MPKIPKRVVSYFPPALNRKDYACGGCPMTILRTGGKKPQCTILDPAEIDIYVGGCNFFVPGEPMPLSAHHKPMRNVPAAVANYSEDGPFSCKRCKYFISHQNECVKVAGYIHADGCCDFWERASGLIPPPDFVKVAEEYP